MITFEIDNDTCFTVSIKYQTTPDHALYLHNTVYHAEDESITLSTETALHTVRTIKTVLENAFWGTLCLDNPSLAYNFGHAWNVDMNKHYNKKSPLYLSSYNYTLFSNRYVQTWIYNVENEIVMEIAPSYPWHGLKNKKCEHFYPFDDFIEEYKPIAIHTLDYDLAQRWIDQATYFLSSLEAQFENWCATPGEHQAQLFMAKDETTNDKSRRIGTSCGQIVVFDKIQGQQFFGHVREVEDLEWPARIMLEESGQLDLDGSIVPTHHIKTPSRSLWAKAFCAIKSLFLEKKQASDHP